MSARCEAPACSNDAVIAVRFENPAQSVTGIYCEVHAEKYKEDYSNSKVVGSA